MAHTHCKACGGRLGNRFIHVEITILASPNSRTNYSPEAASCEGLCVPCGDRVVEAVANTVKSLHEIAKSVRRGRRRKQE